MARSDRTSAIIDGILKVLVTGGTLSTAMVAPNILKVLDKPVIKYLYSLEKRAREREVRRIMYYMNNQGLIQTKDYEHGITITKAGRNRLSNQPFESLKIGRPAKWDHRWRIVFFDIPEKQKSGRDALTRTLRNLGFYQLQRSVLIHPYPCREVIESITATYDISKFVTYIETDHIDQEKLLIKKFKMLSRAF